jgi:multicomponent Na+:H+ antiporter subunit B
MLTATALSAVFIRDLFTVVMLFGVYSLLSAGFFLTLNAPDVALTEAAIGAGFAPILMLGTLALIREKSEAEPHAKKSVLTVFLPLVIVTLVGAALVYATFDMPYFADPQAPAHGHVAPRYIQGSVPETGVPNIVTSVLASYRGFDTLGETFVIFTAGIGVLALLGFLTDGTGRVYWQFADTASLRHHTILHVISKILIPLILLYALYVQVHGEHSPGGGFQAGVIFATAFILYAMVYGLRALYKVIKPKTLRWIMAAGVLIYGGTGIVSLFLGGNYLDYDVLAHDPVHGQHIGITVVELGVGISVAAVMMSIFSNFAGRTIRLPFERKELEKCT